MTTSEDLAALYHATADDFLYAIGALVVRGREPAPYIHIFYREWPREKLEVVRDSCSRGLMLTTTRCVPDAPQMHIRTREIVALHQHNGEDTSILRAPAWDACLAEVEDSALRFFEATRQRQGGFLIVVQTPDWEFLAAVDDSEHVPAVGPIQARELPIPDHTR